MKALVAVEMRRLLSRRLLRWLTVLALVGFAVAGTIAYVASNDSPRAVTEADARYEADLRGCISHAHQATGEMPPEARANPEGFCEEQVWRSDPRFVYNEFDWVLSSLGIPLIMLGWLVGASFVGAEWHSRTITTLLTWEPRRVRVLAAKAVAVVAVVFAWVLTLQAMFSAAMYPAAAFEGSTAGLTSGWWSSFALLIVRTSALSALAATLGLSISAVGRNTAAALGIGFVYLALVESLIRGFKPQWVDWLIGDNVALFLVGPADVTHLTHSQAAAGLLLLAYAGAVFVFALAVFRRREIA
ncbi:MAG: ABC transporter permease subunit [Actinomycetota bacterium]